MPSLTRQTARLRKLFNVLREPAYRRALRNGVAAATEHDAIPLRRDFQTVIDAGANRGQFAVFAARRFPDAALLCFEPLGEPASRIRRVLQDTGRLKLWEMALGAANQEAEFHVSASDDSSSLLPIGPYQREAFPGTEEQSVRTVQVRRLDQILRPCDLKPAVMLKIDVQGGELGVLQGAQGILQSIDTVLVEASFVELYRGQPLVDDLWEHLHEHGFACRGVWSISYGAKGECLQADLLFARPGFEPFDVSEQAP